MRTNEIKNKNYDIKNWEDKIKRKNLKYKTKNYTYDFQQYKTVRSFGESIYTRKARIAEAEEDQSNLLKIQYILIINLDLKTKKARIQQEILLKVYMLFMKVKN